LTTISRFYILGFNNKNWVYMKEDDNNREYLSRERFQELQLKLKDLKTKKRVEIAEHLEYAKGLGDLSENVEYQEAKEAQMINESDIMKLEDLLSRAKIISNVDTTEVRVGSTVHVKKNASHEERFTIVGREEANPAQGKISYESPIGKSFLGKKKNEKILVSTPRGEILYHIVDIA